jgi:predicted TIM-barrel fold metal-dependent hydrolase
MWGSDYPHTESTFPRSRLILSEILGGIPADEAYRVVAGNAAELYSFTLPSYPAGTAPREPSHA